MHPWLSKSGRVLWTLVSITAVTILIWLYAEGENVRRYDAAMDVQMVGPRGRQLVIAPDRRSFQISFTCAADQLAMFRQLLQEPFNLEVNEDPTQPQQILVMRDRLAADSRISKLGISIVDVQPATMPVRIEALVPLTLPVRVKPVDESLAESVTIDPLADPAQATVLLPASIAKKATPQTAFEVSLDPARLTGLAPNIVNRLAVPLSLPADLRNGDDTSAAAIEPAAVNVSVTIKTLTAQTTLPAVPIKIVVSPGDLRVYDPPVLSDDHVRNLVLRGPRNIIKDIEDGKIRIYAELRLSAEELETASRSKDGGSKLPVINTPPGVSLSNLTTPVRFIITRRP